MWEEIAFEIDIDTGSSAAPAQPTPQLAKCTNRNLVPGLELSQKDGVVRGAVYGFLVLKENRAKPLGIKPIVGSNSIAA
jgi:hypothetical protein